MAVFGIESRGEKIGKLGVVVERVAEALNRLSNPMPRLPAQGGGSP